MNKYVYIEVNGSCYCTYITAECWAHAKEGFRKTAVINTLRAAGFHLTYRCVVPTEIAVYLKAPSDEYTEQLMTLAAPLSIEQEAKLEEAILLHWVKYTPVLIETTKV